VHRLYNVDVALFWAGRHYTVVRNYFGLQFDKFVSGDVDLCNCTLLRRFHGRVDVSDWYAVRSLTDVLNMRLYFAVL